MRMKNVLEINVNLIEMFRKAYNSDVNGGIISCAYKMLSNLKGIVWNFGHRA